jgi:tetratricopeptide (TPR) repeat protein
MLSRRGSLCLLLGQEKEGAADLARALQSDEKDYFTQWWSARASLAVGDRDGYRRACALLLKHFDPRQQPQNIPEAVRTAMLIPDAVPDLGPALKLVLGVRSADNYTLTTQGGLLRAGQTEEAVTRLQQAVGRRQAGEVPVADLLLAVAQHKQGKTAEARRTLDQARLVLDQSSLRQAVGLVGGAAAGPVHAAATAATVGKEPRWDWQTALEVRVLRREAETLIDPPAPQPGR